MRYGPLFLLLLLATLARAQAQEQAWSDSSTAFWARTEAEFADSATSPLKPEDRAHFQGIHRFPYDPAFHVTARFTPARKTKAFTMKTTTDRRPRFLALGKLTFTLQGRSCTLTVYQGAVPSPDPANANYLFLPFRDLTSGEETYGGGRYIDLPGPLKAEVDVDFNMAYNPYCAYNDRYSCPIPPPENVLEVPVRAGALKFHD